MKVDLFAESRERAAFERRVTDVYATIHGLGLEYQELLVGGGAALAVHGINAYMRAIGHSFDVDAFITGDALSCYPALAEMQQGQWGIYVHASKRNPLPADLKYAPDLLREGPNNQQLWRPDVYMVQNEHGVQTLPPGWVLRNKLQRGIMHDVAGGIKAHAVAVHEDHPIIEDPEWLADVAQAVAMVRAGAIKPAPWRFGGPVGNRMPGWLRELKACDFKHPAFKGMTSGGVTIL